MNVVIVALKISNDFSFLSPTCFISVFISFKEMETQNVALAKIVPVPVAARSKTKVAAAHLLRLWFRIPPESWMSVCCECCVLSGRGLGDELITRPEKSYRVWCV